jgi:hypothetical protein
MDGMFSLDDIGKCVSRRTGSVDDYIDREIVMVLKAPRGEAVMFKERPFCGPEDRVVRCDGYTWQSEAVRAFMEQHRGE